MRIALANDHGGLDLRDVVKDVLVKAGCEIKDFGTETKDSVDYPDLAMKALKALKENLCDRVILICGTGIGMSICANRIGGVRATLCHDAFTARMSREHNNSNCLVIGGRTTGPAIAQQIVEIWLETPFEGGRHQARLDKIETAVADLIEDLTFEQNQS